ncbi:MAG TPA: hypothetical protein VM869_31370 [Enhygromyxa sp.]|nr:hypothetical protein [Enhygromyxa sp.]
MISFALTLDLLGAPPLLAELQLARVPSLWATLTLGYLGVGTAIAWHLGRKGHGLGVTSSALACWPLLLGLIGRAPPSDALRFDPRPPAHGGPNATRIDACMRTLAEGLAETLETGGTALIDATQLAKLADALHRADGRIARVDRLLRETEGHLVPRDASIEAAMARLRSARERAHAELEAVLAGLIQLRVQLGLFTLAGESEPVRERLAELEARVAALAELSSVELAQVRS